MLAARAAGVSYRTALKAFKQGFGPGMPPIADVIRREQRDARALLSAEEQREQQRQSDVGRLARENVAARADQGRAVRMARVNSLANLVIAQDLLTAAMPVSHRVAAALEDPDWNPTPAEAVTLLLAFVAISRQAIANANLVEDMEARILGAADVPPPPQPDMTIEEAVRTLAQGERSLERVRRRARLREAVVRRGAPSDARDRASST